MSIQTLQHQQDDDVSILLNFSFGRVGVREALEAIGVEVLIGRVPMSGSIEERAKALCEQIEDAFPGREVNLIGESFLLTRMKVGLISVNL